MNEKFIIYEGVNGVGKTTLLNKDVEIFKNQGNSINIIHTSQHPLTHSIVMPSLNTSLSPVERCLRYIAAQSLLLDRVIEPSLAIGNYVLCDRFLLTTLVYHHNTIISQPWLYDSILAIFNKINPTIKLLVKPAEEIYAQLQMRRKYQNPVYVSKEYEKYKQNLDGSITITEIDNIQKLFEYYANKFSFIEILRN